MFILLLFSQLMTLSSADDSCAEDLHHEVRRALDYAPRKTYDTLAVGTDPTPVLLENIKKQYPPMIPQSGEIRFPIGPWTQKKHLGNHEIEYQVVVSIAELKTTELCEKIYACLMKVQSKTHYKKRSKENPLVVGLLELVKPGGYLNCPAETP